MGRALAVLAVVLCVVAPIELRAQSTVEEFALGGGAFLVDESCIRLTRDLPFQSGSAWHRTPVDLRKPFTMTLQIVLGHNDIDGADGIVFVFHPAMATGFRGEGMGFAGLVPSIGIEFDSYRNLHLGDPGEDHLALLVDGNSRHDSALSQPVSVPNLEDGRRHGLSIRWDPNGGLEVQLDGKRVALYGAASIRRVFGTDPRVFWGMTAATGRLSNVQDVCVERIFLGV